MSILIYRGRMSSADRPLVWLHGEVKTPPLSVEARIEAGVLLRRLQRGEKLGMPHSRPMPSIGRRCLELRIPDKRATWRIILRVDEDAVVILEVFSKKTRATSRSVIDACKGASSGTTPGVTDMNKTKIAKLKAAGWKIGSVEDFLALSKEEAALVEIRIALAASIRRRRLRRKLTQSDLAMLLKSSQSRVAKMEAADSSVSIDLLLRSLLALGVTPSGVAKILSSNAT